MNRVDSESNECIWKEGFVYLVLEKKWMVRTTVMMILSTLEYFGLFGEKERSEKELG